jgi:type VI protein secretion system component VasK
VPRVVNGALAALFLVVLAPLVTSFGGRPGHVQVALVLFSAPFLLVAVACAVSALWPGAIGRAARRLRRRRR